MLKVKIKQLNPDSKVPVKANKTDACFDVWATSRERIGEKKWKYGLGFACEIPEGYRINLKPRSSIHETGLILANCTGTIDHLYRKEFFAIYYDIIPELPIYKVGDKIAQLSLEKVISFDFEVVTEIEETNRGGFGSTGKR